MFGITIFAGIVITAAISIYVHRTNDPKKSYDHLPWPIAAIIGAFATAIMSVVVYGFGHEFTQEKTPVRWELASINGEYLNAGIIGEKNNSTIFYNIDTNGGIKRYDVPSDISTVFESENGEAYMLKWCDDWETVPDWIHWPLDMDEDRYNCSEYIVDRVEFYVPAGGMG